MLELFLIIGTFLMLGITLYAGKIYQIQRWKTVMITVVLTFAGLSGTQLLFFIESGHWGGTSFFGAIFFAPLIIAVVAFVIKSPIGKALDLCAPAECIMLALMKVRCLYYDCCKGRMLRFSSDFEFRFPSQIIELLTSIVLMCFLVRMIKMNKFQNQVYAWYMILYGITRFFLNFLRDTKPFIWVLPAGNFWAMISVVLGILWLFLLYYRRKQ